MSALTTSRTPDGFPRLKNSGHLTVGLGRECISGIAKLASQEESTEAFEVRVWHNPLRSVITSANKDKFYEALGTKVPYPIVLGNGTRSHI